MTVYRVTQLKIWKSKLPQTKFAVLPPHDNRQNPLVTASRLYASVFSPGAVCALDRCTGKLLWRQELNYLAGSSVYLRGGLLFATTSQALYALHPESGQQLWTFCPYGTDREWIYSSPCVYRDCVYVGDRRGFLHCLDAKTGQTKWRRLTNRAKNGDVNATAIVTKGLLITATNAGTAIAYDARNGGLVWRTKLDGPSASGLFQFRGLVGALTQSLYLLEPTSGKIRKRFGWQESTVSSVTSTHDHIFAVVCRQMPQGTACQLVMLDESQILRSVSDDRSCSWLRYIPETGLVYLSHLEGVDLLAHNEQRVLCRIRMGPVGNVGLVDVKSRVIYALTDTGYVYALRHPPIKKSDPQT